MNSDQKVWIYPVEGGEPRPVPGMASGDVPFRWSDDHTLFVGRLGELPVRVYRLDLSTGRKELWKEIKTDDLVGVNISPASC